MRIRTLVLVLLGACGSSADHASLCNTQSLTLDPTCNMTCNAQPGAADTCPDTYHCSADGVCDKQCDANHACGTGYLCTPDGYCVDDTSIIDCTAQNKPPTTISGKILAPNGTLPLYGIDVYTPAMPIFPFQDGAQCTRCTNGLPGAALAQTQSIEDGTFQIKNAPTGDNIRLVVSTGKWRRQYTIPHVTECTDNPIDPDLTRLPKNTTEGEMPKIALSTGSADALECLLRKLGIADSELGSATGTGRVNLMTDGGAGGGEGTNSFAPNFAGGTGKFTDSTTIWNNVDTLKPYDIVIFSCEGAQHPETKSKPAMDALKAYADLGGRVFLSHWHNIWVEGSTVEGGMTQKPDIWPTIAQFSDSNTTLDATAAGTIDEMSNPKGMSFAQWMINVGGSTTRDLIPIEDQTGKNTCSMVDANKAERWVYLDGTHSGGVTGVQNFQFTTPNEVSSAQRCGKVVFSDMHVSGDSLSSPGKPYPTGCSTQPLTPQEKALAFMFFDISSCVSSIF